MQQSTRELPNFLVLRWGNKVSDSYLVPFMATPLTKELSDFLPQLSFHSQPSNTDTMEEVCQYRMFFRLGIGASVSSKVLSFSNLEAGCGRGNC